MAKNRKKIFPKPVQRLNETNAKTLGRGSNNHPWANSLGIYNNPIRVESNINERQQRQLEKLRKNLGLLV